ncbi:MAG TPA: type VI secretion system tube protein Hcp [Armatimonadota bacterium]|jgi:type VI secretion system Hcp family effector
MRKALSFIMVLACLIMALSAASAANIWVSAKGTKQGAITSGAAGAHAAEFAALGVDWEVVVPTDVASGLPTGQVRNKPLKLYRNLDVASVKLFDSINNGETLAPVVVSLWMPDKTGTDQLRYQITLTNARVIGISYQSPYASGALPPRQAEQAGMELEVISLTYQSIDVACPGATGGILAVPEGGRTIGPRG